MNKDSENEISFDMKEGLILRILKICILENSLYCRCSVGVWSWSWHITFP